MNNDEFLRFTVLGGGDLGRYVLLKRGITYKLRADDVNKLISIITKQAYSMDVPDRYEYRKMVLREWKEYIDDQIKNAENNPDNRHVIYVEVVQGCYRQERTTNTLMHLTKLREKLEKALSKL